MRETGGGKRGSESMRLRSRGSGICGIDSRDFDREKPENMFPKSELKSEAGRGASRRGGTAVLA